jgi:hypothetical protein
MSSVKDQNQFSGVLGKTSSIREVRGRLVVANRPKRKVGKLTARQQEASSKFLEAAKYASVHSQLAAAGEPSEYASGITGKKSNVYLVALSDFIVAPTVHFIEAPKYKGVIGETITIKATDDFRVASVEVTITDGNGAQLESGNARVEDPKYPFTWAYKTTVANQAVAGTIIRATAMDVAKNRTSFEITI